MTSEGTVAGALLGTAAYMSPEQAKARTVDRRADVWAFGCVFFEMLTGKKMFAGDGISETLASVLRDEPNWDALPAATPVAARLLLRRCLDRDVRMRLRDIGEARVALSPESLAVAADDGSVEDPAIAVAGSRGRNWLARASVFAAIVVAAFAGWFAAHSGTTTAAPEVRAAIRPPKGQLFEGYGSYLGNLTLSPDGTHLTFSSTNGDGRPMLHLRSLGSQTSQPLTGTEGATFPFWSPDGRSLAFFIDGKLKRLDLEGGAPMTICSASAGRGGSWGKDGVILFTPDTQAAIYRVSASGGEASPGDHTRQSAEGGDHTPIPVLPSRWKPLFFIRLGHAAALDDEVNSLWVGSLDGAEPVELVHSVSNAAYAMGHLFYIRDHFLMARPFDHRRLEFSGEPFVVGEDVVYLGNYWRGAFAVAENGLLAYQGGLGPQRKLIWYNRDGTELGQIGKSAQFGPIRLSRDGRQLAATITDPGSGRGDIWIIDTPRDVASRLTFSDAHDTQPVWSPDGTRVAFQSDRAKDTGDVFLVQADGRGEPELLFASDGPASPTDWSPDGKYVSVDQGIGKNDLWIVPVDGGDPFTLVATPFDEGYARFSPDSSWIAYVSNESGRYELYLTRIPSGDGKWQLSVDGGDWAIGWKEDGSEIYYLDLEGALCSVRVELGENVVVDRPQQLFETRSENTWASAPDGQRFVLGAPENLHEGYPINLIANWAGKR